MTRHLQHSACQHCAIITWQGFLQGGEVMHGAHVLCRCLAASFWSLVNLTCRIAEVCVFMPQLSWQVK